MKISIVSEDQINERIYATSPTDENKYEPTYDAFYWGWGGDNDSPALQLRRARLRVELAGLDVLQPGVRQARRRRAQGARRRRSALALCTTPRGSR